MVAAVGGPDDRRVGECGGSGILDSGISERLERRLETAPLSRSCSSGGPPKKTHLGRSSVR